MNCYIVTEEDKSTGFNFRALWNVTQQIQRQCPNDIRLFDPKDRDRVQLTNTACEAISGKSWTQFPAHEVIARITLWKLPLVQLVSLYPCPPLGLEVTAFVICHLLGDPIDTIWSLLHKLCATQWHATFWETEIQKKNKSGKQPVRDWKALALIASSYDECRKKSNGAEIFHGVPENPPANSQYLFGDHRKSTQKSYQKWAGALAADRSTKFLPVIVAEGVFIFTIASALVKTSADHTKPAFAINGHSLAFSVLYFWILPATLLGSIIGVSQSKGAIPRILKQLEEEIRHASGDHAGKERAEQEQPRSKERADDSRVEWERIVLGGVYSWQPGKWNRRQEKDKQGHSNNAIVSTAQSMCLGILALFHVLDCTISSMAMSWITPPEGRDCRHILQGIIFTLWLGSTAMTALIETMIRNDNLRLRFNLTLAKDILVTLATGAGISMAHAGIFNRCVCWTQWDNVGLALPYEKFVADILSLRIRRDWPIILGVCAAVQLAGFVGVLVIFIKAFRVFLQLDDGSSNIPNWMESCCGMRKSRASLSTAEDEVELVVYNSDSSASNG